MINTRIQDEVDKLEAISSLHDFKSYMMALKDSLGFDHLTYAIFNSPNATVEEPLVACSYDPNWLDYYFTNDCINNDPIVQAAQNAWTPYMWEHLKKTKKERKFMSMAHDFGISPQGITIPIRRMDNELALVSISTQANSKNWDDLMNFSVPVLRFVADYCHDRFMMTFANDNKEKPSFNLTERERECLLWTSRGKSNWEIARILNIAERTVTFHITNACKKLGVNSRFQAAVIAIARQVIYP